MFEDAAGELWDVRLRLGGVARLRLAGVLDLNAVCRERTLGEWLSSSVEPVLRAAWTLLEVREPFARWLKRFDPPSALRLRGALFASFLDFFRKGFRTTKAEAPNRTCEATGSSESAGNWRA